jgi:hypothetical protein
MAKAGLSQHRIGFDRRANAFYIGDGRSGTGTGFSPNSTVVPAIILTPMFLIRSDYR